MNAADSHIHIRRATVDDEPTLWTMLYYAAHMSGNVDAAIAQAQQDSMLRNYVEHWGRSGDLGVIAQDASTATHVGAAWLRLGLDETWNDHGFHEPFSKDSKTGELPELAIAVLPTHRKRQIGARLLQALIDEARGLYPAITLNVREANPAVRLYQRVGFVTVGKMTNRVDGVSLIMRYDLS